MKTCKRELIHFAHLTIFALKSDKFHCFIKIAFMIRLITKINLFEFYDFYLFCE